VSAAENEPPLALDMDFDEAMKRFANTDPREIKKDHRLNHKRKTARKKKPNKKA